MEPNKNFSKLNKLFLLMLVINMLLFALFGYMIYQNNKKTNSLETALSYVLMNHPPNDTPMMAYEPITYTGIIKKEAIPEEYALGDYWYIFYFDSPQMIETAAGKMERGSLEISASTIDSLEPYLGQEVTVKGRLSYGYAESRVILADEITLK